MDGMKKTRGCYGLKKPDAIKVYDERIEITKCPVKEITSQTRFYMQAYSMFKNGYLPNGNGYVNESFKYVEVMNFIDSKSAYLQEQEERRKSNGK